MVYDGDDWHDEDEYRQKPKTIPQLMLRNTPYGEILHSDFPKTIPNLVYLLDALDYVVEEWLESMRRWSSMQPINKEGCEQDASGVLMSIIGCRYAIIDWLHNDEPEHTYMDVLRAIKELKQNFIKLAKPYLDTPPLGQWYLDLPMKVQYSFKHLHSIMMSRKRVKHEGLYK